MEILDLIQALYYSQTGCSVPPNIARLPSILQCSCANCSEQVAPELAISVLTNLLISILSWQIFADTKIPPNNISYFAVFLSAKIC